MKCFMIYSKRKFLVAAEMITINGVALQRVRETKFLGVVISDDLKWKKQIDVAVQKVSKIVGIFYGTCHVLSFIHSFKDLYSTSSRKLLRGAPDSSTVKKNSF